MQSLSLTLSKRLSNSKPLFRISSNLVAFASSSSTTTTTATSSPPLNSPPPPISAANGSALSSPTLNNFLTAPWFATQSRGITLSGSDVRVGKIIENQGRVYEKTEDSIQLLRRGFHIEPGTREKALLAEDSALKPFKSYKKSVKKLKRVGDVLTIVVVAGCCYEIYVKAVMREEAREQ